MPPVSPPSTEPRDLVERLLRPALGAFTAHQYSDGILRDPLLVEAAQEIERLRLGLPEPKTARVFMGDGGASAYRLVALLVDALGHLSGLQQGEHVMDPRDIETAETILVTAACEIYTGLTGVKISPIETYKKIDASRAEREAKWHASRS